MRKERVSLGLHRQEERVDCVGVTNVMKPGYDDAAVGNRGSEKHFH